jgi:2-oxoisovalerate dehydrogenase E2 component (dihydrolipoyl transacylase)
MAIVPIKLPQVGETVVEGIIDRWLKKPGDRLERFDPLVEIVTDKVNMEVSSPFNGVLTRIIAKEGATVPMGAVIAEMETSDPEALAQASKAPEASAGTAGVQTEADVGLGPTGGARAQEPQPAAKQDSPDTFYSPVVSRLALQHNVDLSQVRGTGINGRVTKKDVLQHVESRRSEAPGPPGASTQEEVLELSSVRRIIAQHVAKSASQIPHAWAVIEVDVTNLVTLRQSLREEFKSREGLDITLLPFVIQGVVRAIAQNPRLNSTWRDDHVVLMKRINIGVAVAAPDGLVVPVIPDTNTLSVAGINRALRDLSERARQGKLNLEEVQGGTFTVNNTGALGIVLSQPIINHPQAAILTTEAVQTRPVVINDDIVVRSMMNMCLTFDHRIFDGLEAGGFLQKVRKYLETMGPKTPVY